MSEAATSKADLTKTLHKEVEERIEKWNFKVASKINKGGKEIIFQLADTVWIHFRKELFLEEKVTSKRGGPLSSPWEINNNAYKIDLPVEFLVHSTFNVADLSSFDVSDEFSDSRTISFEEGEDNKDHNITNVSTGPITQPKSKKIQQVFILHLQNWIGSVQPSFHVLQADSIEEGPFGASEVNICIVEIADEIARIISWVDRKLYLIS